MATATAYAQAREAVLRICDRDEDARTLRLEVLSAIRRVVEFDAYAWLLTDPETSVGSSPLADVPCLADLPQLIRLKYLTTVNRWTGLLVPVATLSEATGGDLSKSAMWQKLLFRYHVSDIASSVYRDRFGCWGFLDLWRTQTAPPFISAEIKLLHEIAGPVTAALRRGQARTFVPSGASDQVPRGPVVLVLSPSLEVRAQTPTTQRYLRVLVPPDSEDQAPIPASAYNVAAQLLATEAGVDGNPPVARVHLANGVWLTLRASRLDATAPASEQDIAVSIEMASPHDRVSVFARAFALSSRERELLDHLVSGADTRETAGRMFVSEHTVQDHLKSIFSKTATRNRRTLLARAIGA